MNTTILQKGLKVKENNRVINLQLNTTKFKLRIR